MLNNLIIDNFFENPDQIRKIALSRYYRYGNDNRGRMGWRGERSFPIRTLNSICPCCNQEINSDVHLEQEFLLEISKKIFNICQNHYNFNEEEFTITSYFHITTEETRNSMPFFSQDKFHQDGSCIVAGVVYLTPDAPLNAGTTILHAEENQFVNLENKYNRLVAYEAHRIHALSETFGTTRETGRLTFTFFIHDIHDPLYYDQNISKLDKLIKSLQTTFVPVEDKDLEYLNNLIWRTKLVTYKVIDNFLNDEEFKYLENLIINDNGNESFYWKIITEVAAKSYEKNYNSEIEKQLWNWYAVHPIYDTLPLSPHFDYILNVFRNKWELKSLMRIKVNFYPYTSEVKEHAKHQDYEFEHKAAVFSLNTCDGFTRMSNGDKVDSVANRIVFFDGSEYHNSSTTSNQKGRYNINFNYF